MALDPWVRVCPFCCGAGSLGACSPLGWGVCLDSSYGAGFLRACLAPGVCRDSSYGGGSLGVCLPCDGAFAGIPATAPDPWACVCPLMGLLQGFQLRRWIGSLGVCLPLGGAFAGIPGTALDPWVRVCTVFVRIKANHARGAYRMHTWMLHSRKTAAPYDPTLRLCLGPCDGPRGCFL